MWVSWVGCLFLPIGSSYLLLSLAMPSNKAFLSVMGSWPYVFNVEHRHLWFFRWVMGTLNLSESVFRVLRWIGWYLVVFIPACALTLICRWKKINPRKSALILFFLVMVLLLYFWLKKDMVQWLHFPQPWQVFTCSMMVVFSAQILIGRPNTLDLPASSLKLMMATFSFVLLGKIILNVRVWHYGFALAMPATLMVVIALWRWIPEWLAAYGGKPILFRAVVLAFWLMAMVAHIKMSGELFNQKQYMIGYGNDLFRSEHRGHTFFEAVQFLKKNMKHGETLAALPEGVMMNYLLRVHSPTPFIYHTPPVMILFGEEKMLSSLKKSPPDWIALVHRDDSAYGARFFGNDYGTSIWRWIAEHYVFNTCIGALPFQNENFGILVGKLRMHKTRFHENKHSEDTIYRKSSKHLSGKTILK